MYSASSDSRNTTKLDTSASVPLYGRYGTATEVSNLVVFLLSDEAEYISGSLHLIDGALNAG